MLLVMVWLVLPLLLEVMLILIVVFLLVMLLLPIMLLVVFATHGIVANDSFLGLS
jgi:hypothetical protein